MEVTIMVSPGLIGWSNDLKTLLSFSQSLLEADPIHLIRDLQLTMMADSFREMKSSSVSFAFEMSDQD